MHELGVVFYVVKGCKEGCEGKSCGEGFCRDTGDWGKCQEYYMII